MAIFLTSLANLPPDLLQGLSCRSPGPILPILRHKPDPAGEGIHPKIIIIYPWSQNKDILTFQKAFLTVVGSFYVIDDHV